MTNDNKGDFLLGMLVGAAVGAAVALLYAPSSGQETREQIRTAADDVKGRAGDLTSTIRERVPEVTHRAQDVASQVREKASGVASSVSGTVQELKNRGKEVAGQAQDAVQQAGGQASGGQGDLPATNEGDKTKKRDQHELRVSDDPDVVADRVNNAMQGSGEEAHDIAEQLAKAPSGRRDETL